MSKSDLIAIRVHELALYTINTRKTVRETAKNLKLTKSTVHKDLTERLPKINRDLYERVREVLDYNKEQRSYRGGRATKEHWRAKANQNR